MSTLPLARYVATATTCRLITEATAIAVVLLGTDRDVAAAPLGLLVAAWTFPQLVTAPLVGSLADRARRPAPLLAVLMATGTIGLLAIGTGLGTVPLALLVVPAVLVSIAEPAAMGALSGIATRSSGEGFEAWDTVAYGAAAIVGQLVVALAAAVSGPPAAMAVLVVLATGSVALTAALPLQPLAPDQHHAAGVARAVRLLAGDRELRTMTVLSTVATAAFGGVALVAVDLAERSGHDPDQGTVLVLALAVGAVLGSLLATRRRPPAEPLRTATGSVAVIGAAFAASAVGGWSIAVVAFFVAGVADASLLVATFASRNRRTPAAPRASVYTVAASLKIAATSLGAVAVGVLIDRIGGRSGTWALAGFQALALVVCAVAWSAGPTRASTPARRSPSTSHPAAS
jgi:predicted MFS family arabinose efflux permease